MARGLAFAALVAGLVLVASPAAAHAAELTFTIREDDRCPDDRLSCIRVTGGPGTEGNIRDDTADVRFEGVHDVSVTVANAGTVDHNVTFEPGTPLGNYSIEDPIPPGESVTFNFTTVEDIPPATYAFYCGQPNHQGLGERGTFTIRPGAGDAAEDEGPPEAIGIPGVGALGALLAGLVASRLRR